MRRKRAVSKDRQGFDNSVVETFFKTLKSELVWRTVFQTRGGDWSLHRRLLQSRTASIDARLRQARSVRRTGRIDREMLFTKAKQIQMWAVRW